MSRARITTTCGVALAVAAVHCCLVPAVDGKDVIQMLFHMTRPPSEKDPSVEQLAEEIDWLEKHIDAYGSVVAKQPDVWGQARMTRHREEYEKQMYQQLQSFNVYLQGTVSQSDQAFLADAFSLSAAAAAPSTPKAAPAKTRAFGISRTGPTFNLAMNSSTPIATASAPSSGSGGGGGASTLPSVTSLVGDPDAFFNQQALTFPAGNFALSSDPNSAKIGIEPTIALDQRDRYLNHLHLLRRRNEGDDTADSPGYALNLVRIPISVLPGKRTYRGYGAEITITAKPMLSPTLLPVTFRNLVINDVVDQLCLPITRAADYSAWNTWMSPATLAKNKAEALKNNKELRVLLDSMAIKFVPEGGGEAKNLNAAQLSRVATQLPAVIADPDLNQKTKDTAKTALKTASSALDVQQSIEKSENANKALSATAGAPTRFRQARNPVPPTQIGTVFGYDELIYVAREFHKAYVGPNVIWNADGSNNHVMYLDVQRFLQAEVEAAYELLACDEAESLWSNPAFLPMTLAEAIRAGQFHVVCEMRTNFFRAINHVAGGELLMSDNPTDHCVEEVVKSLAWAVFVESALLNRQLVQDMRETAQAKQCGCLNAEGLEFYRPRPDPAACEAFNQYVMCRWPIHVFALDPSVQEQNIGDAYSRRRELQLAMSLGFVQGQISAQNLMKFSRRLETDIQTVDLNETIVGFSHGDDTFGWRFYPRLQSPPTKGTLATVGETLIGPRRDGDLLQRKMEPGMYECVAVVIMPSFVPNVTFETRSDWVRLNAHSGWLPTRHKREVSMVDMMKLSRSIRSMHDMATQICDSRNYRPGDVQLLLNRVHQLDQQLPLQGMLVQVPIENTLGGYQMFNNGVTDLAPELHGWYGAPGIALTAKQPPAASKGCSSGSSGDSGQGDLTPSPQADGTQASNSTMARNQSSDGSGTTTKTKTTDPTTLAAEATKLASDTVTLAGNTLTLAAAAAKATSDAAKPKGSSSVALPPDCDCSGTTVFLVGNHFSVVDTRVIAGGMCIPSDAVRLLSRQVMQVTIPWNARTVTIDGNYWVDVHVATPYGITGHLHIPAFSGDPPAKKDQPPMVFAPASPVPTPASIGPTMPKTPNLTLYNDPAMKSVVVVNSNQKITLECDTQFVGNGSGLCPVYQLYGTVYAGTKKLGDTRDGVTIFSAELPPPESASALPRDTESVVAELDIFARQVATVVNEHRKDLGGDPTKPAYKVRLFLKDPSYGPAPLPDLHVSQDLPFTVQAIGSTELTEIPLVPDDSDTQ